MAGNFQRVNCALDRTDALTSIEYARHLTAINELLGALALFEQQVTVRQGVSGPATGKQSKWQKGLHSSQSIDREMAFYQYRKTADDGDCSSEGRR